MHRLSLLLCLLTGTLPVLAQPVQPQPPRYSAPRFVRVTFENDILQLRDRDARDGNFTNGVRLDLMGNFWKRLPTRFLLLEFPRTENSRPDDFDDLYSFSIGQEMYTPGDITLKTVDSLGRPYAGWLYASSGLTTVDVKRGLKLTSSLNVGVIGPLSGAAETQATIHRWIDSPHPEGWRYQVRNALGVSYAVRFEARPLPQLHRAFDVIGLLEGHAGTITNYLGGGFTLRIGQFNDYFQNAVGLYDQNAYVNEEQNNRLYSRVAERRDSLQAAGRTPVDKTPVRKLSNRRFQAYLFMRPVARIMLDNSFLQGGWRFRGDNPYTLRSEDVTRFFVTVEYGGVIAIKRFQLTYTQSFRTKEFRFGEQQQWGRISLLMGLK